MAKNRKSEGTQAAKRLLLQAIGYDATWRMKLVHFATSFFLALEPKYRPLRLLNIAAFPKFLEKRSGDPYVISNLMPILSALDSEAVGPTVDPAAFAALREHLNAAFNNDGASIGPAFPPYSQVGEDYSAPSLRYLTGKSKHHGGSGFFVWLVLNQSPVGQEILRKCRRIADEAAPTAHDLGLPLVEAETQQLANTPEELCGFSDPARLRAVAALMAPQTAALGRLVDHLVGSPTVYSLRQMMIGIGSWLLFYEMRYVPGVSDPIIFCDFSGEYSPRVRAQAAACYSRRLGAFGRSLMDWCEQFPNELAQEDAELLQGAAGDVSKKCEDHFRDFSVRTGWVQPRSGSGTKFFRPQPDTLRVLLTSVLDPDEWYTMDEVARRLRECWQMAFGLLPDDHAELRRHGFGPLDEDCDLRGNREAFKRQAVLLGLAREPSDGLVLFRLPSHTRTQVI